LNRKILLILTAAAIAAGTCGGAVADAAVVVHDSLSPLVVLTEPQAGLGPIYQLIKGAHSSVDLTMYELADAGDPG
jgi:hypothetical protein